MSDDSDAELDEALQELEAWIDAWRAATDPEDRAFQRRGLARAFALVAEELTE